MRTVKRVSLEFRPRRIEEESLLFLLGFIIWSSFRSSLVWFYFLLSLVVSSVKFPTLNAIFWQKKEPFSLCFGLRSCASAFSFSPVCSTGNYLNGVEAEAPLSIYLFIFFYFLFHAFPQRLYNGCPGTTQHLNTNQDHLKSKITKKIWRGYFLSINQLDILRVTFRNEGNCFQLIDVTLMERVNECRQETFIYFYFFSK